MSRTRPFVQDRGAAGLNRHAGSSRFAAWGRCGAFRIAPMNFPAIPALTRVLAALLLVASAAMPQARSQEASPPAQQHQAVPFRRARPGHRQGRAAAPAAELGHASRDRDRQRDDQLHRHRGNARAARPVGRTRRGGVLRLLCRGQAGGDQTAGDLRVQRRSRRSVGLSASRPCRPAAGGIPRRPRGPAAAARQSADLAAVHRPGDDRPGRLGLQPSGARRWRQCVLGRGARRRVPVQGDREMDRGQPPRRLRRNSSWARAMAASAPPRWQASCAAPTASRSTAS